MRRLLAPAVVLCALLAPATANAGIPFTVGEGRFPHVALDAAQTAHVVWTNEADQVFHCRLPRGAADCQPLTTLNAGSGTASAFALIGSGSNVHIAVPNGALQKTDLFTSADGGLTWGPQTKIYSWGGGAGRTEPVPGPQAGQFTFAGSNPQGTVWSAALDASENAETKKATLPQGGGYDFQVAPTGDGGLVAVTNDLANASFFRMAPGGDPSENVAWGSNTAIGAGHTTRVAGGPGGTYMLASTPAPEHMEVRKWNGSAFGPPVAINEVGYINDIFVGPSGAVAATWRQNQPGEDFLRFALSTDGGATFNVSTIAIEDVLFREMDVAIAPDNVGLVVYEGAGGSSGARNLIRVVNTLPVSRPATIRGEQAFTEGTPNDLYLACTQLDLNLIDVLPAGRRVSVTGAADLRLVGQTAEILLDGTVVGTAVVNPDGSFAATVRAPSRRRRARARYQARIGTTASQQLRLRRRMVATTLTRNGANLVLRGRVTRPFARRVPIEVERVLSCGRRQKVTLPRVVRPSRTGAFTVTIPVPTDGARSALFRARTRVPRRRGGRPTQRTFTLPRAIGVR